MAEDPEEPPRGPSWAELTAVPPRRRGPRIGILGMVGIAGAAAVVAVFVAIVLIVRSEQGQVMFTTTDPNGGNSCVVLDRVSSVNAGTHSWMVAMLQQPLDDQPLTVYVTHDGAWSWSYTWPVDQSKGRQCTWGYDMATYAPGTWTFTFTHAGKTEATGTLIIR